LVPSASAETLNDEFRMQDDELETKSAHHSSFIVHPSVSHPKMSGTPLNCGADYDPTISRAQPVIVYVRE
jgi:hypothetical protein